MCFVNWSEKLVIESLLREIFPDDNKASSSLPKFKA